MVAQTWPLADALAEKGAADAHAADQDRIVVNDRLGRLAAQKAPPDTHRIGIEITNI